MFSIVPELKSQMSLRTLVYSQETASYTWVTPLTLYTDQKSLEGNVTQLIEIQ